jgi:uncharacterized membrane protein
VETHSRSIAKAVSYRLLGSIVTGGIVYFFSGDAKISAGVGAIDVVAKIGLYFLHERLWNYISFGRQRPPEYEI